MKTYELTKHAALKFIEENNDKYFFVRIPVPIITSKGDKTKAIQLLLTKDLAVEVIKKAMPEGNDDKIRISFADDIMYIGTFVSKPE